MPASPLPRTPSSSKHHVDLHREPGYWRLSMSPLHILVFLLPLILVYEFGSFWYLQDATGVMRTVSARNLLGRFFDVFGAPSFHLPAITLVVVLLLWHVLNRDSWRIRPGVLLGMALESCVLMIPLLVLGLIMNAKSQPGGLVAMAVQQGPVDLRALSWQERLTLSIGAGLYEELVFRLVLITGVHLILCDVLRVPRRTSAVIACVVSALAFALYHDVSMSGLRSGTNIASTIFLTTAGLYFAGLFLVRGFGIVVATHALYDIVVLVVITAKQ
ncbi:MAG: CPBP family intramembrane metalloprotease [Phycisphaeraceae bacterium]|nr:CPBP family intramembrane metalloprotease [Phycisphaeraceae bacterium]